VSPILWSGTPIARSWSCARIMSPKTSHGASCGGAWQPIPGILGRLLRDLCRAESSNIRLHQLMVSGDPSRLPFWAWCNSCALVALDTFPRKSSDSVVDERGTRGEGEKPYHRRLRTFERGTTE
jgi:hypothetical protein